MATPSYVDCVAMALETDKGKVSVRLSVLNRHPKASWNGKIEFVGFGEWQIELELYMR